MMEEYITLRILLIWHPKGQTGAKLLNIMGTDLTVYRYLMFIGLCIIVIVEE